MTSSHLQRHACLVARSVVCAFLDFQFMGSIPVRKVLLSNQSTSTMLTLSVPKNRLHWLFGLRLVYDVPVAFGLFSNVRIPRDLHVFWPRLELPLN